MPLTAGVAYEGNRDLACISIIVARIAEDFNLEVTISEHEAALHNAHTAIVNYIQAYTESMFSVANVDLAFYFTDQDNDRTDRRRKILEKIEACGGPYIDRAIVGVAKPHFESWLLADEDTVKRILHYQGDVPLPHRDYSPKSRLSALISESDIDIMFDEAKVEISKAMDFDILKRSHIGFSELYDDFRQKIVNAPH